LDFLSKISFLNLSQFNSVLNNYGSILDLVLSNMTNISVTQCTYPFGPCDVYHPSLFIVIPFNYYNPIEYNLCIYDFYSCYYSDITKCLGSINWLILFENLDVNRVTNLLYSILYEIIDLFVLKKIKSQRKYPL